MPNYEPNSALEHHLDRHSRITSLESALTDAGRDIRSITAMARTAAQQTRSSIQAALRHLADGRHDEGVDILHAACADLEVGNRGDGPGALGGGLSPSQLEWCSCTNGRIARAKIQALDGIMEGAVSNYLSQFEKTIMSASDAEIRADPTLKEALAIQKEGNLLVSYAPFEYVQRGAKVVIADITPGAQQAGNALLELKRSLAKGASHQEAIAAAKVFASFSGPMRTNLVAMLDYVGLHRWLGLTSVASLWTTDSQLVNFTSAIRFPAFVDGKNYNGKPDASRTPVLRDIVLASIAEEHKALPGALWVPLGPKVHEILMIAVTEGVLPKDCIVPGLQHPSGANAERIAYFLGRKAKQALSSQTNPSKIDAGRTAAIASIQALPKA